MKRFYCTCGQPLFFENTKCLACNKEVAYEFETDHLHSLTQVNESLYQTDDFQTFKQCANYYTYNVCNVVFQSNQQHPLCIACQLNQTIPNLDTAGNIASWSKLECAKRRLVRTLLQLGLPVISKNADHKTGMAFAFLEDQQQNQAVFNEFVSTGHLDGLITINLAETDDTIREHTRVSLGELYRTLLGHLRHEVGHYYFDRIIRNTPSIESFRAIFGNEQVDYNDSLQNFYRTKSNFKQNPDYISEYAQSHPLEDWAECWSYYLHMTDTLETAYEYGLCERKSEDLNFESKLNDWAQLVVVMNELNRSMGLNDVYPFISSDKVIKKLNFVHQVIDPTSRPKPQEASV